MAQEMKVNEVQLLENNLSNVNLIGEQGGEWIRLTIGALMRSRSHIGQYIFSSTLDTMQKVIEQYGGKTWERVHGRFLFGADDSHQVGERGGELEHTLTVDEMPSHNHGIPHGYLGLTPAEINISYSDTMKTGTHQPTTYTGGNQPHNNMPPYEVVYIWKRIE